MNRAAAWTAAAAGLVLLCGCDEQTAGVGPSPGPVAREEVAQPRKDASADKAKTAIDAVRLASQADAGADGLPAGDLFDGSGAGQGKVSGTAGGLGATSGNGGGKTSNVKFTAQAKHKLVGEPPKPGQKLPQVSLPEASPEGNVKGAGPVMAAFDAFQRRTYATLTPLFSRLAWGAKKSTAPNTAIRPSHVTVHHTAGHLPKDLQRSLLQMRNIQAFHQDERRWGDIGYHFVLDGEGRVFEGRHADIMGAHAGGANTDNIGISLMGDYDKDAVSDGQKTSLRRLITFLALRYRSDPSVQGFINPHKHYNNTGCPGKNALAFLAELRREVIGDTKALVSGGKPQDASASFVPLAIIQA